MELTLPRSGKSTRSAVDVLTGASGADWFTPWRPDHPFYTARRSGLIDRWTQFQ